MTDLKEFNGTKGKFTLKNGFLETWLYTNEAGSQWEEDGYMPQHDICNLGTTLNGQEIILEQMSRSIDSGGKNQPDNNFCDVFKSFAAVMGAIESSRTGKTVYVPDAWKHMGI